MIAMLHIAVGMITITMAASPPDASAEAQPSVTEVLDALDISSHAIQSFDVQMTVTRRFFVKPMLPPGTRIDPRNVQSLMPAPLGPDEKPREEVTYQRQLFSGTGNRRLDQLDGLGGKPLKSMVGDGATLTALSLQDATGVIKSQRRKFAQEGEDYLDYFRNVGLEVPLVDLFRERTGTYARIADDKNGTVLLETGPDLGAAAFGQYGFRAFLDVDKGMLPSVIEKYRTMENGQTVTVKRVTVKRFSEVADGVWAPVAIEVSTFGIEGQFLNRALSELQVDVDLNRSSWNRPLAPELFQLTIPPGTIVSDRPRDIMFVAGAETVGKNVDQLVKESRDVVPTGPAGVKYVRRWRSTTGLLSTFVLGTLALIAVLVIMLLLRRRKRGGS